MSGAKKAKQIPCIASAGNLSLLIGGHSQIKEKRRTTFLQHLFALSTKQFINASQRSGERLWLVISAGVAGA
jgi:hypothetical protein